MDRSPAPISTVPVARGRSLDLRVVGIAVVLVALTLVRPWGDGQSPSPAASPSRTADRAAVAVTALPPPVEATPRPSLAPDQIPCTGVSAQLVSLDRLGPWTARTWVEADPTIAAGPADPAIAEIAMSSQAVLGVGVCLPADAVGAGPSDDPTGSVATMPALGATVVAAWSLTDGRPRPLQLQPLRSATTPGLAILYRPDVAPSGRQAAGATLAPKARSASPSVRAALPAWPPGRYVLRLWAPALLVAGGMDTRSPGEAGLYLAIVVPDRT